MSVQNHDRWVRAGRPMPVSAIRIPDGECAYDCDRSADFLVKVQNTDGQTVKIRVCKTCSDENRIWAERYLPSTTDDQSGDPDQEDVRES